MNGPGIGIDPHHVLGIALPLITSAKEGYVLPSVCLFVCFSICWQDNSNELVTYFDDFFRRAAVCD